MLSRRLASPSPAWWRKPPGPPRPRPTPAPKPKAGARPLAATPGLLTGNGRPRRAAIAAHYADTILALYPTTEESCPA